MRRAPQFVLGLLLAATLAAGPSHGDELKDLYFGEALYYAHQGLYFEALDVVGFERLRGGSAHHEDAGHGAVADHGRRRQGKGHVGEGGVAPDIAPRYSFSTAMKAPCGTSTLPTIFIRFLPFFCFSSSLRLRLTSPP